MYDEIVYVLNFANMKLVFFFGREVSMVSKVNAATTCTTFFFKLPKFAE